MYKLKQQIPILEWLPAYKKQYLQGDLAAGITIAVMLIPQGMAYALIAGLPPVYGLYASIIPQIVYAILGTSRQLSVAPVATDSILVAAGVSIIAVEGTETYISLAILLALLVGVFQFLLGALRMGFITNLLSKPVISGFTSAAAIIIAVNQLKYLLGIDLGRGPVFEIISNLSDKISEIHFLTLVIGISGILIVIGLKNLSQRIPGMLIAVVLGTLVVYFFQLEEQGVNIVKAIPGGLPSLAIPGIDLQQISQLIPLAITISIVGYMEAFSVAKVIESKKRDHRVSANQELRSIGAANIIGSFFQSYPVTGGFSRSAVNMDSGARTQLSSLISASLIAVTLMFLTPLFYYLPTAILASVILVAVAKLIDLKYVLRLFREERVEFFLLLATFSVTLVFSMVPGIVTGVILSILLILYHAAYPHIAILGRLPGQSEFRNVKRFKKLELWEDKIIIRVDAPLTFINIQYVKDFIRTQIQKNPKIRQILVDASAISYVDATAVQGIADLLSDLQERKVTLIISDVVGPVRDAFFKTGLHETIGTRNIFLSLNDALDKQKKDTYINRDQAIQHND